MKKRGVLTEKKIQAMQADCGHDCEQCDRHIRESQYETLLAAARDLLRHEPESVDAWVIDWLRARAAELKERG